MISYQNDPSADLLKSFIPPFKGTWKTLPVQLLPDDALFDSMNVTLLSGKLRSRLGHLVYDRFSFNSAPIGSFMFIDSMNTKYPLVSTATKLYKYNGGYSDITSTVSLNPNTSQVRMTSIQVGSSVYLLYTNGYDELKYSDNASILSDITPYIDPVTGTSAIPVFTDICTTFSRIVGISPPYTISWCSSLNDSYLNFTNWPALNQAILSETEDALVCIGALGTLGIAVYKEGSIYVGFAQQGSDAQAFRFEFRGEYEGPAGVQAKVNVNGTHIYMTPTGRVGQFDGTQHNWICDGLWPFLQDDIDTAYAYKIFGIYNYKTSEVYFYYPKVGDSGLVKGMLIINLPYPTAGVTDIAYFLGYSTYSVSNGLSVKLFNATVNPFIYGLNSTYKTYILDKDTYTDDSSAFTCSMNTGLFRPNKLAAEAGGFVQSKDKSDIYRPILEPYFTRDSSRGTINIAALTVSNLETNGIATEYDKIDLTTTPINEYLGYNESGSFLGLTANWQSTAKVEYKGCDVFGRKNT